jgi:hypothetical protein
MRNKLQFRGPNLIQKLDDGLKKLTNITEYTPCKRRRDLADPPAVGWRQVGAVERMRNSSERIFIENCFDAFEE